ncbi:hypothetical protein UCDDS831_g01495 [Diplodia seriata]|uniref:Uncharacterized protein n=1 Tax=Diplodia seriata TaxID=420778 RepID=A0A0G2HD27_9PEZI|nr:hypothetical protein UCDDS831_g01495 [Diplodia seriata]
MSGIEVAGLVLGAFPLLICAIDSTKQVSKLAELLVPLIPDDEESLLSELLAQPGCAVWKRPDLIKRLDKRLPSIRDEYLETMVALNDALEDLGEELGFTKKRFKDILLLEGGTHSTHEFSTRTEKGSIRNASISSLNSKAKQ